MLLLPLFLVLVIEQDQADLRQLHATFKGFPEIVLDLVQVVQARNPEESVFLGNLDLKVIRVVVEEEVLELRHGCLVQTFLLEEGLSSELLEIDLATKSISVTKCHLILISVVISYSELTCAVWTYELEVLSQEKAKILLKLGFIVLRVEVMVRRIKLLFRGSGSYFKEVI